MSVAGPVRCGRCGQVIGVYEPLVVQAGDVLRESSLAADPLLSTTLEAALYHRECDSVGEPTTPPAKSTS